MDNSKFFIRILSTKKWRDWWIKRLVQKPNRLFDLETQEPMIVEKRIHVERPRVNDFIDFFCNYGIIITIKETDDKRIYIKLEKGINNRIIKIGQDSMQAIELAMKDYLKESSMNDRW